MYLTYKLKLNFEHNELYIVLFSTLTSPGFIEKKFIPGDDKKITVKKSWFFTGLIGQRIWDFQQEFHLIALITGILTKNASGLRDEVCKITMEDNKYFGNRVYAKYSFQLSRFSRSSGMFVCVKLMA